MNLTNGERKIVQTAFEVIQNAMDVLNEYDFSDKMIRQIISQNRLTKV